MMQGLSIILTGLAGQVFTSIPGGAACRIIGVEAGTGLVGDARTIATLPTAVEAGMASQDGAEKAITTSRNRTMAGTNTSMNTKNTVRIKRPSFGTDPRHSTLQNTATSSNAALEVPTCAAMLQRDMSPRPMSTQPDAPYRQGGNLLDRIECSFRRRSGGATCATWGEAASAHQP